MPTGPLDSPLVLQDSSMKKIAILAVAALFAGCAARSPQQLELNAWDTGQVAVASQNETLNLSVQDARGDTVLGSRGGAYEDTALLSLPPSALSAWQQTLRQAFADNGWQAGQPADLTVTVRLLELDFTSEPGESVRRVLTNTSWQALVEVVYVGANGSVVREHRVTRQYTDFPRPSREDNQARAEEIFQSLTENILASDEWERIL